MKTTRENAIGAMKVVLNYINKGREDEHTEGTAERYIRAWDEDWAEGYDYQMKFTTFTADDPDQMVIELDIPVLSHCSHHLAPIIGICHIAYLPGTRIVGLSKLNRTVEKFARRLQVQERLTAQIAQELFEKTVTTKLLGNFLDPDVKSEFFQAINSHTRK